MKPQAEVSCVGEVIVDFVSTKAGATLSQTPGFLKHAGGAAANVAVGLSRLGVRTSFIGKVGHDPFGEFLKRELRKCGVETSGIRTDDRRRTRLAFVSRTRAGERDFAFWEAYPADEYLETREIDFIARTGSSRRRWTPSGIRRSSSPTSPARRQSPLAIMSTRLGRFRLRRH